MKTAFVAAAALIFPPSAGLAQTMFLPAPPAFLTAVVEIPAEPRYLPGPEAVEIESDSLLPSPLPQDLQGIVWRLPDRVPQEIRGIRCVALRGSPAAPEPAAKPALAELVKASEGKSLDAAEKKEERPAVEVPETRTFRVERSKRIKLPEDELDKAFLRRR